MQDGPAPTEAPPAPVNTQPAAPAVSPNGSLEQVFQPAPPAPMENGISTNGYNPIAEPTATNGQVYANENDMSVERPVEPAQNTEPQAQHIEAQEPTTPRYPNETPRLPGESDDVYINRLISSAEQRLMAGLERRREFLGWTGREREEPIQTDELSREDIAEITRMNFAEVFKVLGEVNPEAVVPVATRLAQPRRRSKQLWIS